MVWEGSGPPLVAMNRAPVGIGHVADVPRSVARGKTFNQIGIRLSSTASNGMYSYEPRARMSEFTFLYS